MSRKFIFLLLVSSLAVAANNKSNKPKIELKPNQEITTTDLIANDQTVILAGSIIEKLGSGGMGNDSKDIYQFIDSAGNRHLLFYSATQQTAQPISRERSTNQSEAPPRETPLQEAPVAIESNTSARQDSPGKIKIISQSSPSSQISNMQSTGSDGDCSNKDLESRFGPTRSQGALGWCSVYDAAYMLSFYQGQEVSALDIGMTFIQEHVRDKTTMAAPQNYSSFVVSDVIETALQHPMCSEDKFPSDDHGNTQSTDSYKMEGSTIYHYSTSRSTKDYMNEIVSEISRLREKIKMNPSASCSDDDLKKLKANPLMPGLDCAVFSAGLDDPKSSDTEVYYKIRDHMCTPRTPWTISKKPSQFVLRTPDIDPTKRYSNVRSADELVNMIDEKLNSEEPTQIGIHGNYFSNPLMTVDTSKDSRADGHGLIAIGRTSKFGKCYYKFKNSWGRGCLSYNIKFSSPDRCDENGNIYLTREELTSQITDVTRMD